jgi:hypothetical protein
MDASGRHFIHVALFFSTIISLFGTNSARAQMLFSQALSCTTISVGRIPINDLGTGYYQGYQGGLYPEGVNQLPATHLAGGLTMADQVLPRTAGGAVDTLNGKVVLLSIGMSNATQEFSTFIPLANADPAKNPKLVIVDGAQGGQTAAIISNPNANFWTVVNQRLSAAGVTRQQVQVTWVKEANANPTQAFPRHAQILDSEYVLIARILKSFYPNVVLSYWSSRTYGGYATTTLNPEPYAYESGFALKWTLTRQINGDTALTYSGTSPRSPWLAWGPYLWADGLVPRSDGLIWECDDFVTNDRTHPSASGRLKVANMLLNFFKTDTTTTGWFLRGRTTDIHDPSSTISHYFSLGQNYPNPFNPSTTISYHLPAEAHVTLRVFDVLGREVVTLVDAERTPGAHNVRWDASGSSSGVYYYRLDAGDIVHIRKALLVK